MRESWRTLEALVDVDELMRLREMIGREALAQLVEIFASYASERISAIEVAVENQDPAATRAATHLLRTGADILTARWVVELTDQLEHEALEGTVERAPGLLERLRVETAKAKDGLLAFVDSPEVRCSN